MEKTYPINHFAFRGSDNLAIGAEDYVLDENIFHRNNVLADLKQLNIIVGANNSGKSRLIREVFSQLVSPDLELLGLLHIECEKLDSIINDGRLVKDRTPLTQGFVVFVFESHAAGFYNIERMQNMYLECVNELEKLDRNFLNINGESVIVDKLNTILDNVKTYKSKLFTNVRTNALYVPTLRGMRPVTSDQRDLYKDRTIKDYFSTVSIDETREIFTGLSVYKNIKRKLLGNQNDRLFVKEYENFLSENFFNNSKITLIPREQLNEDGENDVVYINFDGQEFNERAMYNLGDGLQTIICITYPLFEWVSKVESNEKRRLLACIEEPELYLHPSMQRNLVRVLMSPQFKCVQYFITTHSNHFLDLVYEHSEKVSIYSVILGAGAKKVKQESDLAMLVYDQLGSRASSVLLANKTIWVEGVSDIIYLKHALNLYLEQDQSQDIPVESLDYAFVEYGGSNLSHYFSGNDYEEDLNIDAISKFKNIFLLADSDNVEPNQDGKPREKRYAKAKKQLGEKFKLTKGREIENYILPEVLKKIFQKELKNKRFSYESEPYQTDSLAKTLHSRGVRKYLSKDGKNIRNKNDFARKVVTHQKEWEDLSLDMQKLIEEILSFIRS